MNKLERVRAALSGAPLDHPPFTLWYHFGLQHASAERMAQAHLDFFDAYDLDWLKLMNDYSYPMPKGVETLDHAADLERLGPLDLEETPLGAQLKVIEITARALAGRALVVDTLFNAWNTLRRNVVKGAIDDMMREHPAALGRALGAVNDNLIRYAQAALQRGAAGIFLSVPASTEFVSRDQYERFMRPYDLELLEAIRGRGTLHVLHAHGNHIFFDRMIEYPVQALSWADRDSGPTLGEARRRTDLALMGGISQGRFAYESAAHIRGQIRGALADAGGERGELGLEEDGHAGAAERVAVPRIADGAPAQRADGVLHRGEALDDLILALPERQPPLLAHELVEAPSEVSVQLTVEVEEGAAEPGGQPLPECGLPRADQAREVDIHRTAASRAA